MKCQSYIDMLRALLALRRLILQSAMAELAADRTH